MDKPDRYATSVIGHELAIEGDIKVGGSLLVEGEVTGNITGPGITVGSCGNVVGGIFGEDIVIEGHVTGSIEAQTISIGTQAVVKGDLAYQSLAIEHGARFEGGAARLEKKPKKPSA